MRSNKVSARRGQLSLAETKSEHADGAIRRELDSPECAQRPEQAAVAAHTYSEISVSVLRCKRWLRSELADAILPELPEIGENTN